MGQRARDSMILSHRMSLGFMSLESETFINFLIPVMVKIPSNISYRPGDSQSRIERAREKAPLP